MSGGDGLNKKQRREGEEEKRGVLAVFVRASYHAP